MKVLIAGCPAILRRSIVTALLERDHEVRVLMSNDGSTGNWPARVEPWSISDAAGLEQAANGCDALIRVDPGVAEPWTDTADGAGIPTVDELGDVALRASVRQLVHVAARTTSDSQVIPRHSSGTTTALPRRRTVRTSLVYGTGTDPISLLLIMMRSLPAVPTISNGHVMQPLWHMDLGRAIASIVGAPETAGSEEALDLAGPEPVTFEALYERIGNAIDRRPMKIPVPDFLATNAARLAEALHLPAPFEPAHLAFVRNAAEPVPEERNALSRVLGASATPLDEGLRLLIHELDELTPNEGVGGLEVKRFYADIREPTCDEKELIRLFRARFADVMPVDVGVEPAAPRQELEEHAVLTLALPGRGHVQIRVEEITDEHVIVSTVRGHAVAGIVRFRAQSVGGAVRFEILTCDTAANALDWLALTLGGARLQDANWTTVVQNVVQLSGGTSQGPELDKRKLTDEEAAVVDRWIKGIIQRQREAATPHA